MSAADLRVATPEEAVQRVDALNMQPRGPCVKAGCKNERAAWRVVGGGAVGTAFCAEHQPKLDA